MKYASDFSAQRPRERLIFLKISIKWSFCGSVSEMKLFMIKDIYILYLMDIGSFGCHTKCC